ncbi:Methyltransf_21 domain-containing protein [Caenorhabditis elegans]|nr:Methyltransf_21 domain-containing protein [Caenorhabditis elegans]CDK13420.1 Methyltransf_21 domain-containing protein [Caenorhabditis elegans]|eukprot:NP_001293736.1 Uncharacterized protein CELE_C43G2.3 [Caenorhabditis elegans]
MISVRAIKQMLSGQVDYRYKADTMQMGRFISLDNLKDQKFDPSQHIAIEKIIVNGLSKNINQDFQTCFKSWPKELIADHGIYVSEPLGGQLTQWARMYFEPDQLGEAI